MTEPLTPPDCDLQDFPFMPLHVARLRDSDLAGEECPEACWYALLLWAASWHQLPAGSLPDNETVLTKLIGLGRDVRTFRRHREGAMRGFIKCSDGRLYHPVVAEQVLDAWERKRQQRWRSELARIKKATFSMPVMSYVQSMDWDDLMAEGDTVLMRVFQPGLVIPNPGAPLVKGAGQAGTSLTIDGLPNGYVIRKGQFLSVVSAGQRFLYRAKASATSVAGTATIPLRTMLRRPPNDNDVVEIAQPMIEGFVRDLGEWAVGVDRLVGLQFTVRERE